MSKTIFFNYKEPIFLIAGENSTFLDGAFISKDGIILDQNSSVPPQSAIIEFSFHGTDRIINTKYSLKISDNFLFLKFESIAAEDLDFIQKLASKNSEKKHQLEA